MITFVNGFLCQSGCDIAKAKHGEDPHPKIDPQTGQPQDKGAPQQTRDGEAVTFGGALSDIPASRRVTGVAAAEAGQGAKVPPASPSVDLLI